jgi:hypothetical protein
MLSRKPFKGFTQGKDIVEGITRSLGLDARVFALESIWKKELGAMAADVTLQAIKRNVLIAEVSSNAHLQEMALRKKQLIIKINGHYGSEKFIKDIKFKLKEK